ncbi:MAG TPA: hypothetical protein VLL08_30050 [Kineosporiaceae bacterium]|nr:hypothetical protein [Kineosporiaceae bacterium]
MRVARLPLLTVTYTAEPEIFYEFGEDGARKVFGRDDATCDIVIWAAINGQELSRVAGAIWRMDDELWVRNLSTRHELYLEIAGRPAEPALPPRSDDGTDRGPARSIPTELAFVRAPGGCELLVRQVRDADLPDLGDPDDAKATFRAPPVPEELRAVAAALCEPLLLGSQVPATHAHVTERAATGSPKRTRNLVTKLCTLYADEVPTLRDRVAERVRREQKQLGVANDPRLEAGIWTFDPASPEHHPGDETTRRRELALPDYFEIAHLLVRRRLITSADLVLLPPHSAEDLR